VENAFRSRIDSERIFSDIFFHIIFMSPAMVPATAPCRIVLVEDNPADVLLVRRAIAQHQIPCDVQVLSDGEEVLTLIDRLDADAGFDCPELFLMDVNLPKRDGWEILQRLRTSSRCAQTPVIVMSGSDWTSERERAATVPLTTYFVKPSSLAEFMNLGMIISDVLKTRGNG
jgi:CheY-like chemotaxis protein